MLVVFGSTPKQREDFQAQQKGVWVKLDMGADGECTLREALEGAALSDMRHEENSRTSCPIFPRRRMWSRRLWQIPWKPRAR